MSEYHIIFQPRDITFTAEEGENLLEVAMKAGIHINASCGGNSTCGRCKVRIVDGNAGGSLPYPQVSLEEFNNGIRLACKTTIHSNLTVEIPLESQVDRRLLKRIEHPRILSASDMNQFIKEWKINPPVMKHYIELPEPTVDDNISDADRLLRELKRQYGMDDTSVSFGVLRILSERLRSAGWKVTVTISYSGKEHKIVNVESGDAEKQHYGIAIDIGTTTICGQLLDTGKYRTLKEIDVIQGKESAVIAETSDYNSQISYGEDVISRIMYSRKRGGLKRLQKAAIDTINSIIKELVEKGNINPDSINHIVMAGNTTMTHLAIGLNPQYLMLAPYTPAFTHAPSLKAKELNLNTNESACVSFLPCVASYIGGDIVAGILGTGIFERDKVALYMDIGTNGEIVLGNKDWLLCASCSAGPAFEGGGIKYGMRAGKGAIEQVHINPSSYEPMILTVEKAKPAGICGSGLIDIVAELLKAGLIDQNGKFKHKPSTDRIRRGDDGAEYIISYAKETAINKDIVITEVDMDNILRAKAAMYAGCKVLLDVAGLEFKDVDMVFIAGGFGHYINPEKAQLIGLLPEVPLDRFVFVGNGSLLGARLVSFSQELMKKSERISSSMTNIDLSQSHKFMDEFIAAMFLPHTNRKEFSQVFERLE